MKRVFPTVVMGCAYMWDAGFDWSINAAGARVGQSFVLPEEKTLTAVRVHVVSVAGDPNGYISCNIMSTSGASGMPDQVLQSTTTTNVPLSSSNLYVTFTGLNYTLSANTKYFVVIRNDHPSPTLNYIRLLRQANPNPMVFCGSYTGFEVRSGSDSTGWNAQYVHQMVMQLIFSDGSKMGFPYRMAGAIDISGSSVCAGLQFTTPPNLGVRVVALNAVLHTVGSNPPWVYPVIKDVSHDSLITTGQPVRWAVSGVPTQCWLEDCILQPNTAYRVYFTYHSGNIDGSNYIRLITNEFDSQSADMVHFNGTARVIHSTNGGANWTTEYRLTPIMLVLDHRDPWVIPS